MYCETVFHKSFMFFCYKIVFFTTVENWLNNCKGILVKNTPIILCLEMSSEYDTVVQ